MTVMLPSAMLKMTPVPLTIPLLLLQARRALSPKDLLLRSPLPPLKKRLLSPNQNRTSRTRTLPQMNQFSGSDLSQGAGVGAVRLGVANVQALQVAGAHAFLPASRLLTTPPSMRLEPLMTTGEEP